MNTGFIGRLAAAALLALGAALATPAAAGTVSGTYTGLVSFVTPPLDSHFAVNDAITFSFSYDDTLGDTNADPTFGQYPSSTMTASVSIGSYTFSATGNPNNIVGVRLFTTGDAFGMAFSPPMTGAAVGGLSPSYATLNLDGDPTLFASDALPTSYLAASLFHTGSFIFYFSDGFTTAHLGGTVDGLTPGPSGPPTPTPIPAALPLFASALAGLGCLGWRRRRAA